MDAKCEVKLPWGEMDLILALDQITIRIPHVIEFIAKLDEVLSNWAYVAKCQAVLSDE